MQHEHGANDFKPATILATWPKGSFAESIAIDREGEIFVSLHTDKAIVHVDATSGRVSPFASFDRPVTGLAFNADGSLIVSGGAPGASPGVMWRVMPDGSATQICEIAEAAFLNGLTPLDHRMLVADSLGAVIYAVDPETGQAERWLSDPLLGAPPGADGPGANGVKIFQDEVTISVTGADRLVRAAISSGVPGPLTIVAEHVRADDFAFDNHGALYIATHPAQSLLKLAPDGVRTTLARAQHGMVGATALAFGRTKADCTCVYVTTTGGTMTLPDEQLEVAKLVRVNVGAERYPLGSWADA